MALQPAPETTLAIILGVSECKRAPSLAALPQCENSAIAFAEHLVLVQRLTDENIKNLFDSHLQPSEQIDAIEEWISGRREKLRSSGRADARDIIVYYSGHGGFTRTDQAYYLAASMTREGAEGATSLRYSDLAASLKRQTIGMRRYLILDCCFAAAGTLQASVGSLVMQRVEEELAPEGTAVLCSSSKRLVSIAPAGERYTMFSGALLDCLRDGADDLDGFISLEQLGERVRQCIQRKFPDSAVRPEVHVPDQEKGNPAKLRLFLNAASLNKRERPRHTGSPSSAEESEQSQSTSADVAAGLATHESQPYSDLTPKSLNSGNERKTFSLHGSSALPDSFWQKFRQPIYGIRPKVDDGYWTYRFGGLAVFGAILVLAAVFVSERMMLPSSVSGPAGSGQVEQNGLTYTKVICTGEHEYACPGPHDIFKICGYFGSDQQEAQAACAAPPSKVVRLKTVGGNQCGYSLIEATCTR